MKALAYQVGRALRRGFSGVYGLTPWEQGKTTLLYMAAFFAVVVLYNYFK